MTHQPAKRLCALMLCLLLLGVTACSPTPAPSQDPQQPESTASAQTAQETAQPAQEETGAHVSLLTIGTTTANDTFNLISQKGAFGRMNYNCLANAYFCYTDQNNEIKPYFFKEYELSEDGCTIHAVIPTDKVWHDGQPVTMEDVVFTLEYYRDVSKNSYIKNLDHIDITGENTLDLVFSRADGYSWLANGATSQSLLPKHIWKDVTEPNDYAAEDAVVGCGPYRLTDYDLHAGTCTYEAVPQNGYLGELTVDRVLVRAYASQDAMMMALVSGEIDAMYDYATPVSYSLLDLVSSEPNVDIGQSDYSGCYQVTFGMERAPGTDPAYREAVVKCLDWNLISQVINGSYGQTPGSGVLPPSCKGFDGTLWIFYQDVEEAKEILAGAGYADADQDGWLENPDGSPLSVKVTPQYTSKKQELLNRLAEVMMDNLSAVGIRTYIDEESLQSSEIWEANMVDGNYDLAIGYTTSGVAQYRTAFRYFVADTLPDDTENTAGATWIWGTDHDEELTKNVWGITYAANEEEYLQCVRTLQTKASEELFAFALCWEKCFFPYRTDRVEGFENWPSWGVVNAETFYKVTAK